MKPNAIVLGWNRAVAGREKQANEHFAEFVGYLTELQGKGTIESFEPVIIGPHGGDMNGLFLIRGDGDKLSQLRGSEQWMQHVIRGNLHMEGFGVTDGFVGNQMMQLMTLWGQLIQKY
jgi:hypothetical protein